MSRPPNRTDHEPSPAGPLLVVGKDTYVVLDYVLYDEDGDVIEATDDEAGRPLGFVWGYGTLVPGLERAIQGMAAGQTEHVEVAPEDGWGLHDPDLERWVDREDFPKDVALDDEFVADDDRGEEITLRVVEIVEDAVLVDANHPLAGEALQFDVMIRAVRAATESEIRDARAHAPKARLATLSAAAPEPATVEPAPEPEGDAAEPGAAEPSRRRDGKNPAPPKATSQKASAEPASRSTHPHRKGLRRGPEPGERASKKRAPDPELEDEQ